MRQANDNIRVIGARENNLRDVTLDVPKHKITVFTGVSGSGKSSLVFDTIAAESRRQLAETFDSFTRHRMARFGKPEADALANLSVAMVVDQKRLGGNARSTVGTATDIHALLRLLYSRHGQPFAGESSAFSFNSPDGMCPRCQGLGTIATVDTDRIFDRDKSLNEGAIDFPTFKVGSVYWKRYIMSGLFDNDKKLKDYTKDEWLALAYAENLKLDNPDPGYPRNRDYVGVIPRFTRLYLTREADKVKNRYRADFARVVTRGTCPLCDGGRLNQDSLASRVDGRDIAEATAMEIGELAAFVRAITEPRVATVVDAIGERLDHLVGIGLGYLSLDRQTATLSGGESQRVKMVKHLGSSLTDLTYVFDEPSIGLHPSDVNQVNTLLKRLRDKGNTVLVVEHDPDVIAIADHVVDLGPHAGSRGGTIVYQGDVAGLRDSGTLTGRHLHRRPKLQTAPRRSHGSLTIADASLHNLRNVTVRLPLGVLTVVTGVAGSGKSSLVNGSLAALRPDTVFIDQAAIGASKRSNTASYTGILDTIRSLFARANSVSASLFSANSAGACPACKGLGVVYTDLAFMDTVAATCDVCGGRRFTEAVLRYRLRGRDISQVLAMTTAEAAEFFTEPSLREMLRRLNDVGLGYLSLGQPLSSLSGGERQRVKLATELDSSGQLYSQASPAPTRSIGSGTPASSRSSHLGRVYVMDEPTTGLHMSDVDRLVELMNRLVDNGSTVVVIEHNLDVIARADWIVDLGPGAGRDGGRVVFEGPPAELVKARDSLTGEHLARYLA